VRRRLVIHRGMERVPLSHVLDVVRSAASEICVYVRWSDTGTASTWTRRASANFNRVRNERQRVTVAHGGPLRIRCETAGYKNVKFVNHLTVTDTSRNLQRTRSVHRSSDTSVCGNLKSRFALVVVRHRHVEIMPRRRSAAESSVSLANRCSRVRLYGATASKAPGPRLESNFDDYARI